jgi:Fuc2NAc and GlcNAc transferase
MAAVSFRVDQREIPPKPRLMIHLILMGILVMGTGGGHYQNINKIIAALFWIVFITGTANFYNFMDGINGIAGIGGTVGFGLLAFETFHDQPGIGLLASGMAFACLGFLPFNLPRARVFMGDIGSIVLGGVFGGLVYLASRTILDFLCLTSFLFPFYVDELTTMIVRLRQSENLTKPHRRHLYQLLANERQIPHWRIATGYGFFQLLVGVSVLITKRYGVAAVIAVLISWFFLFVLGSYYIRRLPSCENGPGQRGEGMPFYGP